MKADDPRWRKIVRRDRTYVEKVNASKTSYNWSRTEAHVLTLECGHTQHRRGTYCPTTQVLCKKCDAGEEPVEVTIELGVFDHRGGIQDPIARALVAGAERTQAREETLGTD